MLTVQYSKEYPWMIEITTNNKWLVVNHIKGKTYGAYNTYEEANNKRKKLIREEERKNDR
jgi:hypothetical protein